MVRQVASIRNTGLQGRKVGGGGKGRFQYYGVWADWGGGGAVPRLAGCLAQQKREEVAGLPKLSRQDGIAAPT